MTDSILIVAACLLAAKAALEWYLETLNSRHARDSAGPVPETFREFIGQETYDRSIAYTLAKSKLSRIETLWDSAVLALLLFSGALPAAWYGLEGLVGSGVWSHAAMLFLILFGISLLGAPLEYSEQFHLEERFGFNKSTRLLWLSDKVKGLLIGAILGIPLLALLLWTARVAGEFWWLWGFAIFALFQLLMIVVYPQFIMPLFNKFEALAEGSLRERLMGLAERTGFRAKTILVMDGSKRSGHSNAFFSGFGRFRRIVLFDTLVEQLKEAQLEAVLAHEIGHYKLGHIPKMLAVSMVGTFLAFWMLGFLSTWAPFYNAFGFTVGDGLGPAFLLFSLLSGLVSFWLSPLFNRLSRKHEYEADRFAREAVGSPRPLMESLRGLHEKNLSNLTPHPLFSGFYYSHPTLIEREAALLEGAASGESPASSGPT